MNSDSALYSQHIKGVHNAIADMLSRDTHIAVTLLTLSFRTLLPEQTLDNFRISPLPAELVSLIVSFIPSLTKEKVCQVTPSRSKLGRLTAGDNSYKEWESKMSSLKGIIENNESTSCPLLRAAADEMNMAKQRNRNSPEAPPNPPSVMFT